MFITEKYNHAQIWDLNLLSNSTKKTKNGKEKKKKTLAKNTTDS